MSAPGGKPKSGGGRAGFATAVVGPRSHGVFRKINIYPIRYAFASPKWEAAREFASLLVDARSWHGRCSEGPHHGEQVHLPKRRRYQALARIGGGGTNCSAPLVWLNQRQAKGDLVIFVSDNESWLAARRGATAVMHEWHLKARNPGARLACLDFVPNATTQAAEREDILNIGGFSDAVFDLLASFANGEMQAEHWVGEVEHRDLTQLEAECGRDYMRPGLSSSEDSRVVLASLVGRYF
jgi:hypothetical protein